ncbi:Outer membrane protein U [Vibrio crassostreae]|uniref:porin n=1 Tax=Vibrio crassostreae TaxID=246167 RepID=UPI001047057F|nr:porin [Vibrio crassostreae]TCN78859.1 outer membrane protein OmpU [Vibrio crassostreae]CAK2496692.1 Outer membrane protein U [Vibrio crassostreae]CAK2498270.1 Outer membrane protein U [Vibrio crassostreae]CAK3825538.1 Outer membrane protein U [Vibrio crassostreae]CAK3961897.1 Outer membrane protein U [Vibrio crassostreae]
MNKTMIALAVSAAALATGANASELYNQDGTSLEMGGRAEARLSMKDGNAQDNSRIRLNFLGQVEIQDGLYGVGFYEGEFTTAENGKGTDKNSDSLTNRYAYAGLGGTFGEVTYGKNDGALGVITDFTDIMAYHGNSAAMKINAADRADNMLSYQGQFQDLSVKASYRFADRTELKADGTPAGEGDAVASYSDNSADGYSLSGIYAIGETGVKLGAGYASQYSGNAAQDEYMLSGSYTMGDLYFAGVFTDGQVAKNDGDYTGYEVAAAYTLGQTVFSSTYNNAETNGETSADNIAVDATYYFKPNFRGYVSYNFNLISAGDQFGTAGGNLAATSAQAEDELALGLRYDF